MDVRDKIINEAGDLMMQYGIRTVIWMIYRNLGISKKTIYQYFKDKKELVNTITEQHIAVEKIDLPLLLRIVMIVFTN